MTELSTIPISRLNNAELDTKIKTEIDKNGIDLSTIATNCITEIPQDIKLELINWYCFEPVATAQYYYSKTPTITVGSILHYYIDEPNYDPSGEAKVISIETNSNGTFYTIEVIKEHYNFEVGYTFSNVRRLADEDRAYLVLKAGSKVYVPNGFESDGTTHRFNEVVIESDIANAVNTATTDGNYLVFYRLGNNEEFDYRPITACYSGSSDPVTANTTYYNTATNNIIAHNTAGNFQQSFPLGGLIISGGKISSIDQVFNGFGYIGSTVFILPEVKGLIPNGRNEDGSLRNIETISKQVLTKTYTSDWTPIYFGINEMGELHLNGNYSYSLSENYNHDNSDSEPRLHVYVGSYSVVNGKVTAFQSKTMFHALDYNDKSTVVGWGMPDWTAGIAISSGYKATESGWVISNIYSDWGTSSANGRLLIDGVVVSANYHSAGNTGKGHNNVFIAPIYKGNIVTYTDNVSDVVFYPCKGVNNA